MTRFREHRGSLDESMKTVVYMTTLTELKLHFMSLFPKLPLKSFTIKPYHGYDTRTGWDTYIVESKEFGGVLGFTDGPL